MRSKFVLVVAALFACMFACRKDEPATTTTTSAVTTAAASTTEAGAIRYVTAVARITGKRCDREDECDPFRTGKRHDTRWDCDHAEFARVQNEVRSADCPHGVDDASLRSCLESIGRHDCELLSDSLQSIETCTTEALCVRRP
jgi:hypothetical protein